MWDGVTSQRGIQACKQKVKEKSPITSPVSQPTKPKFYNIPISKTNPRILPVNPLVSNDYNANLML